MERIAAPFRYTFVRSDYAAQIEVQGLVRLEADEVVVEFRETTTSWGTMGAEQGPVRAIRIPLADVAGIELRRGFFGAAALVLRTRSMQTLSALPNAGAGEARLKIARRNRELAQELATSLRHELAERDLRALQASDPTPLSPGP